MEIREKLIHTMLNVHGRGLEIGPGYNPMFPKSRGFQVETVDHMPAEGLRHKYQKMDVDISKIEHVDYIWQGGDLQELVPNTGVYDFIFASHVIEHIPNIIGFINSCARLLNENGVIVLAVPDKRYCFDAFRPIASTGDILQAHIEQRQHHQAGKIFDFNAYICSKHDMATWNRKTRGAVDLKSGDLNNAIELLRTATITQEYIDIHGWQFVPSSMRLILNDLCLMGIIKMQEVSFYDLSKNSCEFIISLGHSKCSAPSMDRTALCRNIIKELAEQYDNMRFPLTSRFVCAFIASARVFKKMLKLRMKRRSVLQ